MAGFRQRAQEWWNRQQYDKSHPLYDKGQAQDFSRAGRTQSEFEAAAAEPTPNIPFTVYPTHTSDVSRPRTIAAGYDRNSQTLRVQFRSPGFRAGQGDDGGGAIYDYHGVTRNEWKDIQQVVSTGRFINRRLAAKDYTRIR
jgi:hypothetical protein